MYAEPKLWTFAEIAKCEPNRVALLESAPGPDAIAACVISRFEAALKDDQVRVGMEQLASNRCDLRAVLQFPVGEALFDCFFNAETGYRAQFRRGWQTGLEYNRTIAAIIRTKVESSLPERVLARLLSPDFEDCGSLTASREQICLSLDPDLSKVWFCGRRITGDGQVEQLPTGTTGPRLQLDKDTAWAALVRDEQDAWLDVKGAFLTANGLYQPKDPVDRAKKLQASGEA